MTSYKSKQKHNAIQKYSALKRPMPYDQNTKNAHLLKQLLAESTCERVSYIDSDYRNPAIGTGYCG